MEVAVKQKAISSSFSTVLKSRVYNITNFCGDCEEAAEGYCDAVSDGGGWLVVQRRQDGSVDFNRGWVEYEEGNMKKDLVASLVSFGMDCVHYTTSLIKDNGNYALTLHLPMELNLTYLIITLQ